SQWPSRLKTLVPAESRELPVGFGTVKSYKWAVFLPATSQRPSGLRVIWGPGSSRRLGPAISLPVLTSHRRTVPSPLAVASRPFLLTLLSKTGCSSPGKGSRLAVEEMLFRSHKYPV